MRTARIIAALCVALSSGCEGGDQDRPWPTELPPNPEDGAHFDGTADPYYEGWYHKVVLPERGEAFFFIYAVTNPKPGSKHVAQASLYCGRASTLETAFKSYPVGDYQAAKGHRDVRIGAAGRATALRFAGAVDDGAHACSWDIDLAQSVAWPRTMGWLTGFSGLETNWTVGTITARASGWVEFDGEKINFTDQAAYGDHNWGIIFPREWVWLQANAFTADGTALAASGGSVQMDTLEVQASMIGLLRQGKLVTFRTLDGDDVQRQAKKGQWSMVGKRSLERVTVKASCKPESMFHLLAPTLQGMAPRAWESLQGKIEVTLESRTTEADAWKTVFKDSSGHAGVELGD